MDQEKQLTNGELKSFNIHHEQESSSLRARKKINFLFDDLLQDLNNLSSSVEEKIDLNLNNLKKTFTTRGFIQTFPKTAIGIALTGGYLLGKSTNKSPYVQTVNSSSEESPSQNFINEVKAIGFSFITRYILNLLSETLDSTSNQSTGNDPL